MLLAHILVAILMGGLAVWQMERGNDVLVVLDIAFMCVNIVCATSYM